ncbi:hypothetical protein CPLU01_12128 [Colletotrichum plurivorum]|uniref:CorA-like transporter domain-containing protein n=1 Tax=Colletotrichum plurivorum TaxID=2175906 RepID=A0A8H6K064_9PEZI|nr:hypothetical protein CPLU01_12128 [Colletotrichum plurivorum]
MITPPPCFVDEVVVPVSLHVISTDIELSEKTDGIEAHQCSTSEQLSAHITSLEDRGYSQCYISISQRNSWGPLQVTKSMFDLLAEAFDLQSSVWDLATCFYERDSDLEDVFCIPFIEHRVGPEREMAYSIRYPEYKPFEREWVIRQTGVYHKFNTESSQNLFILFNPTPDSKAHQRAEDWITTYGQDSPEDIFWLHRVLFQTYLPAWRLYSSYLEELFIPIADNAVATFIQELSNTEYNHLTELAYLENRFLQIPTILTASQDVLEELSSLCNGQLHGLNDEAVESTRASSFQFRQYRRRCEAYSRVAVYLQQRAQKTNELLAITLSFREQLDAKSQNDNMLRLNKSAVFITTLTLLYLPPSFVATFFGMNFFDLDKDNDQIVGTSMIWIYALCSTVLTAGTFLIYHLLLDGTILAQLQAKVPSLKELRRRRVATKSSGAELGSFDV